MERELGNTISVYWTVAKSRSLKSHGDEQEYGKFS
jgi:hypothetical protein